MITTALAPRPTEILPARTEIGILQTRHHVSELLVLGGYGRKDGYTSLDSAIGAMKTLTRGDARSGVAVLEQDARTTSGLRGMYLDMEDDSKVRLAPFNQHLALRALVDGSKVVLSKHA
jgi:hypothetical protein